MKRWRRTVLTTSGVALTVLALTACLSPPGASTQGDAASRAASHRFQNTYTDVNPGGFWKWQWERWTSGKPSVPEGGWHFPVRHPDIAYLASNTTTPTMTWIGHATVLLQLGGVNILTDPQFSERASPFTFLGPRRWVPPALSLEELPHVDIVIVSHSHYDHLDDDTVRELARQRGGPPRFYVPLGLGAWCRERGITQVTELGWWDEQIDGTLTVHLVPVQHWSARTPWDRNETLWGGFVIEAPGARVFFAGDTGYSKDFADIARRFPWFDLAILPIGGYEPRWFMAPQHIDPAQAVQIHRDLHAHASVGVHWGTFALSDEPLDEPPRKLAQALAAAGIDSSAFWVLEHGETRVITPHIADRGTDIRQPGSPQAEVSSGQHNSIRRP